MGTLKAALDKAGLTQTLRGTGPFTVFAPTDAAFQSLADKQDVSVSALLDLPNLADILKYHVANGDVRSGDLSDGQQVDSLEGSKLEIGVDGGAVSVNDAGVSTADIACSNGVIHVIDAVLMLPDSETKSDT